MDFDFTSIIDRHGLDALAVDGAKPPKDGYDVIPMWVADMNFPTCPAVVEAVIRRAQHPLYGYFAPPEGYYGAIIRWQAVRHGVSGLKPEHIGYENGVLGGVVSALKTLAGPGDGVLVHSPTYVGFTHALEDNGFRPVLSPLKLDENDVWRMDLAHMEEVIKTQGIHAMILCSPHNPCGRVWERWELERVMELCEKYAVYVVSDEIWSDIIRPGFVHIPTQSIGGDAKARTIALYAPSKTFNLAGLVGSYHIIYNTRLKDQVNRRGAATHYNGMNVLSTHALMGAYSEQGMEWTDQLNAVLADNVDFALDFLQSTFPSVRVSKPQGTYMLFLDCEDLCRERGRTMDEVLAYCWDRGVSVQDGRPFHGDYHIRVNLASPKARLEEAAGRLVEK